MCVPLAEKGVSWPFFFFWPCCLSPSLGGSVCFGGLFYLWWRLPPRLVSLGGPLLGPTAVSCRLHGGGGGGGVSGVMRRAIPSPGPLWRGLRIFCLAPPIAGVSPFLCHELSLVVVLSFPPVLRALLRSFRVSSPSRVVRPPSGGPCGVSSPSSFFVIRIAPFDYSPLACQDGFFSLWP